MSFKRQQTSLNHFMFRQDLIALLAKHAGELPASEMLAVASHAVGQIVALQDQRSMTPSQAMEIVSRNVQLGNAEAISGIHDVKGKA